MGKNMKTQWDVIVIGAGAAGMTAAIVAARNGASVLILEKLDKAGKKLLATGNGKCNFTNAKMEADCYYGDRNFVEHVLQQFSVIDALDFFRSIGIYPKEKNGYYYPNSEQAASVVKALVDEVHRLGIALWYNIGICNLYSQPQNAVVETSAGKLYAHKVIIATGLKAAPKLGSDGSMLNLIKELGHRFAPILPALCGFHCKGMDFKRLAGVRTHGTVTAYIDGEKKATDTGEIQFTDYGLSGIPVFQISHYLSEGLYHKSKVEIELNLLPDFDKNQLLLELESRMKKFGLNGLINQKIADVMFSENMASLAHALQYTRVPVTNYRDFEYAQVCTGGILIEDIDTNTLESRLAPHIFFAGEILDVDGICGGYNLHFAWATGYMAGRNL